MSAPLQQSKTYRYQEKLPRLPVPPLVTTCHKYLKTVQPFLGHQEFEKTKAIVEDFIKPGGIGEKLHRLLQERAKNSATHWLQEWWDYEMYFGPRIPIAFNVNYYYHYDIYPPNQLSQTRRAANIISGALHFKKLLEDEELEPDMNKDQPMDISAYEWMFSTCRIPRKGKEGDYLKKYDSKDSLHIVVMRKNNFYWFDVIHNEEILSTDDIEWQLQKVKEISDEDSSDAAIGILTADDRDQWATVRDKLLHIDTTAKFKDNTEALHKLQSAIFIVCLDDTSPTTHDEIARALWHGDGKNRWFDKSIQFIIFENGVCGLNGEHSKLDGIPVSRLSDHIIFKFKDTNTKKHPYLAAPQKISFRFNEEILQHIKQSELHFNKLLSSFRMSILEFTKYGKQAIAKKYSSSPDGWCQLAMLYTYYKQIGRVDACYESASTKKYYHGRTETGRSVTTKAVDWIKAMSSNQINVKEKLHLFKQAMKAHSEYMKEAVEGMGVDRLLLGLYLISRDNGIPFHDIFKDKVFTKSKHWNLSTSQMNSNGFHVGYGPVEEDGFGVCYCIRDNSLWFSISSFTSNPKTDCNKFRELLSRSLEEMQLLSETKTQAAL